MSRFNITIFLCLIEHLDFMTTIDNDLDLSQFRQLEHDYIGYQSLTDVPKALSYNETLQDCNVS